MELTVGTIITGKVTTITKFGAFVALPGGKSGLVHISEVSGSFVTDVHDFLTEGQEVPVKVLSISPEGKISLSVKQAQPPKLELKVFDVLRQLVHPERRALADGRELRGLEVGIGKARQRLVLFGERREVAQHLRRLAQQKL